MKRKWVISTIAITLLIVISFFGLAGRDSVVAAQDHGNKIEGLLLDRLSSQGSADFIVRFTNQADLTPAYSMDWERRGEFVYKTLTDTAAESQANGKAILNAAGIKFRTFIAGNELYVWSGTFVDANALAALPEVSSIRATRTFHIDPVEEPAPFANISWAGDLLANKALSTVDDSPNAIAWGISYTHANQFWTYYGAQGDGMVVANIDTGVQWNHPALDQSFKCGANPSNPACWSDPENWCGGSACDNNGHGTHTMGTMVGDDDPGLTWQAGMAPNAQWIACKGCGTNDCSDFALNSCADWILSPGGSTANRPNVVNNSWGGGGGDAWYLVKVNAWRAAGIFPAFSAGNNYTCGSLGSPGDYQESFASAAHDASGTIAGFSSKGPSAFGHEPYTKPNIAAPGVSVCSSVPGSSWSCGYSGTSMASPHTAGAVALLWSCDPTLVGQIDQTFQILQNSAGTPPAGTCSAPPDGEGNYTYGYGYLDVFAAGNGLCSTVETGVLQGHVYDQGNNPIEGATVSTQPGGISDLTDATGFYTMNLIPGTYDATATKQNYTSQIAYDQVIVANQTTTYDFTLNYQGGWNLGPDMCFELTRFDAEYYPANGLIYILGGRGGADGSSTIGDIYSFNPGTGQCLDTGANMPYPISNYTINLVNNGTADVLCTFGGRGAAATTILNVQCYNPLTNTATSIGNLPAAYTGYTPGAQAVVNNKVYVFGGFSNTTTPYELARTDRYDPVANTFTQIGNLSLARSYIDAVVFDGMIYAFGGTTFDGTNLNSQTRTEVMADPGGAGTWDDAAVAELPAATAEGRAFGFDTGSPYELQGKIVITGGGLWPDQTAEVFTYEPATDTYDTEFPDLINARRDHAAAFVPGNTGQMWVFGGRNGQDAPPYMPAEYYPAVPDIVISPSTLSATLLPDTTQAVNLNISNVGDAPLNWSLVEIPSVINTHSPSGVPQRLSPTGVKAPVAPNSVPLEDVIADGSFEGGTPNPSWAEYSTNFGTPLCDAACGTGTGTGPRTGDWWAWFGGIGSYEEGYVSQDVTLTSGQAELTFWLETFVCDSGDDYLEVLVDGTQVFSVNGAGPLCGVLGYSQQTVDLSAYSDGGVHEIKFHSETFATNGNGSNFFVDDVVLNDVADVPWLSETPTSGTIQPGDSIDVAVTFDSTGLTPGSYSASLQIDSDDPDEATVNVPVSLSVIDFTMAKDAPTDAFIGDTIPYTITVNFEPNLIGTAVITDAIPLGASYAGGVSCDNGNCNYDSGTNAVYWTNTSQPNSVTVSFDVQITSQGDPVVNTANLWWEGFSGSASASTTVASADVSVSKTGPTTASPGETVTYVIEVGNLGPQTASNIVVEDTLPAGASVVTKPAFCGSNGGVVTCNIPSLANGGNTSFEIVVTLNAQGQATNTVSVSADQADGDLSNNTDTWTINLENRRFYIPLIFKL